MNKTEFAFIFAAFTALRLAIIGLAFFIICEVFPIDFTFQRAVALGVADLLYRIKFNVNAHK